MGDERSSSWLTLVFRNVVVSYFVWLLATRTAKLLPHLWYRPQDIIHIPAFILFGYYFAIMKIYALFTLHEVRPTVVVGLFIVTNNICNRPVGVLVRVSAIRLPPLPLLTRTWQRKKSWQIFHRHLHLDTPSLATISSLPSRCKKG